MTPDFASVGQRVRGRRKRFGLTTQELADLACLSRNTVIRIEAGQPVSLRSLEKLRAALWMHADQLVNPVSDLPFEVHRANDSRWAVSIPKKAYQKMDWEGDPSHVNDSAERLRLGRLGFQPAFFSVMSSELPDGVGSHSLIELFGATEVRHHFGEEFVYCVRGSARVIVEGVECSLEAGDSMVFEGTKLHQYARGIDSDEVAVILVVVTFRSGERVPSPLPSV